MATRMQQRRGTAAQWSGANPILAAGEIGFETDTGKFKIGNGSSTWSALNYYVDANAILDGAPGVLDTLNELAAALGDDPAFITTVATNLSNHEADTTNVHGIANTANLVTLAGAETLTNKTLTSPSLTGAPTAPTPSSVDNSTKIATTEYVQGKISELIDSSPSTLDTLNELAAALGDDANFATTVTNSIGTKVSKSGDTMTGLLTLSGEPVGSLHAANKGYVDTEISSHNADTTNVHGIADTAALATKSYADNAVSTHNSDDTNVHGIADTAALATKTYADDAVSTHNSDTTNVHGITDTAALATKTYADDAVSTHNSDTTNVHGIADTSAIVLNTDLTAHNDDTTNVHGIANTADLVVTTDARLSDTRTPTDNTVSTDKIVNSSVTADKLAGDAVTTGKILDGAVTSAKIADGTIVNADINAAAAIDWTKLAISSTVSATELGYVDGVTSAIQTQIDAKAASTDLSTHTGATTSVHGISDTAQLAYLNAANQTFTGNMEVDGNMTVDGNLTVNGTTFSASSTSITIEDNMVQLAHQNPANTVDLGVVVAYTDGTAKHAGIVRDVSDAKWKLFKDVATEPSTTVAFGEGSLDNLAVNNVEVAGVVFSDGTQTKEGVASRTPIIQKTDSYTLSALTERDSLIEVNKASAATITIPTNASVAYPVGTSIDILQTGAGQVTIAGAGGVTVNGTPGLKLRTQWSSATLFKRATDTWVVMGDLSA